MAKRELTENQHKFVVAYVSNGRNGARAYMAAYGRPDLDSHKASIRANGLLKNPIIQEHLQNAGERAQAEIDGAIEGYALSKGRIALELCKIAFADPMALFSVNSDGLPFLDFSKITPDQAAAIQEITVDEYMDGRGEDARLVKKVKFKMADKRASLVDLAKLKGYITEQPGAGGHQITQNFNGPAMIVNFVDAPQAEDKPAPVTLENPPQQDRPAPDSDRRAA